MEGGWTKEGWEMAASSLSGGTVRSSGARGSITVSAQSIYESSADQLYELGTRLQIGERVFRYGLVGALDVAAGLVVSGAQAIINEQTVTVAHPAGVFEVDVTAAAVVAGQFGGGMLFGTAGGFIGESYKIRSNDATGGLAGSGKVRFRLYDPLATAWALTDDVSVIESQYYKVVVKPTDGLDAASGVPCFPATAAQYCWLQTWGPACCIVDTAIAAGAELDEAIYVVSKDHAGQVESVPAGAIDGEIQIGYQLAFADHADNEGIPIFLTIAP